MKRYFFIFLFLVIAANVNAAQYTVCAGCDIADITSGLENITGTTNTLLINTSGTYTLGNLTTFIAVGANNTGVITINATSVVLDCNNSNISGNGSAYGIHTLRSNVTVRNCGVINYSRGIFVEDSSQLTSIINNTVAYCSRGIWLSGTNNSYLDKNSVSSSSIAGIRFNSAINNIVRNSVITSSSTYDISSSGTGTVNSVWNSTIDSGKLGFSDNALMSLQWYFQIFVNDSLGNAVNNTIVNITNAQGSGVLNLTTNASGYTLEKNITAYTANNSGTTYYNNHTFTLSNSTFHATRAVNITNSGMIVFTFDVTNPGITSVSVTYTNITANISWTTDDLSNSTVSYGTSSSSLSSTSSNSSLSTSHLISIGSLSSNTAYYYNVTSCNANGACNTTGPNSFTTLDLTPPILSSIANATISIYSVIISWTTDENATGVVKYGTTTGTYTASSTNASYIQSHSFNISSLSAATSYYYVVNSTDASGNTVQSSEKSFTTQSVPDTTAPTITFTASNQTSYSDWRNIPAIATTSETATCKITAYMLGTTTYSAVYASALSMTASSNTHTRYFNVTADSTGYNNYFTVTCQDASSNSASQTIYLSVVDSTYPTIAFSSSTLTNGSSTRDTTPTITITVGEVPYSNYPKIKFDSGTLYAMTSSSGNYAYTYTPSALSAGTHTYFVTMKDRKGNEVNVTRSLVIDLTEPEIDFNTPDSTIKNCNEVEINVTSNEDGECEYEIYEDLEEDYNDCNDECDEDYDDCIDDADTSSERSDCSDDKDDCEITCEDERYDSYKTGSLKLEYGLDDCNDDCEDVEDDCKDECKDTRSSCYVGASDSDDRNDCDDDYDDCKDDCGDDYDDCKDDCIDDETFIFAKDFDNICFDDGPYLLTVTCSDNALNSMEDNLTFDVSDTNAPTILLVGPNGTKSSTTVSLNVYTSEDSKCKFSESDKSFDSMEYYFTQTGTAHSFELRNLNDGDYTYFSRCNDTHGNVMTTGTKIEFTVDSTADSTTTSAKTFPSLTANVSSLFSVQKSDIAITELDVKVNDNIQNVKLTVSKADSSSISKPSDEVYQYVNIEKEGLTNTQIQSITIKFKVEKTWLASKGIQSDEVYLGKYTTDWNELSTTKLSEDSTYYYYQAEVSDLSLFAIMAKNSLPISTASQTTDTTTPSQPAAETQTAVQKDPTVEEPIEIEDEGTNFWIWILILCVVIVGSGAAVYFVYTHRHPQQDSLAGLQTHPTQDSMAAADKSSAAPVSREDAEISKYVNKALEAGQSLSEIKKALIYAGYDSDTVEAIDLWLQEDEVKQPDEDLRNYVQEATDAGQSIDKIKEALISAGHGQDVIDNLFGSSFEDPEVSHYIADTYKAGVSTQDIRNTLLDAGHDKEKVDALLSSYDEDPADSELLEYVQKCLDEGLSKRQTFKLLSKAGHDTKHIKELVNQIDKK